MEALGIAPPFGFWKAIVVLFVLPGMIAAAAAVGYERRMQQHRQPGVTYWNVTLRLDGGWKRTDLFTDAGLAYQRKAAKWGFIAGTFFVLALICWSVVWLAT